MLSGLFEKILKWGRREIDNKASGFAEVRLRVKESHTADEVGVILNGKFQKLADEGSKAQGTIPCQINNVSGASMSETDTGYRVDVKKNEWLKFEFESEKYDPNWNVRFFLETRNG